MKVYVVVSASSGLNGYSYDPIGDVHGVFTDKNKAIERFKFVADSHLEGDSEKEYEYDDDYFTLVDRDEDYSIEIQIMEMEVDK